ncbi:RNA polymerase sigma-70 factor, ECF subfamily [Granulicella pectinivorans]|jgi:RNA polymerase sigma-70 factor (ECF subfamily)|uniref:RNA polymerase sigma-70 factor, ECF subfamily n=1 Tax=Granulicella pectinivorans TaxID=474950 RepID=A0A1I6L0C5_9BACT|nr:RNA polymerase sigma factor [Granulicella pectinivorans]SFR96698.1 RNA polymerase sigma-70 factor, ECF subfamily [Granulicella pectinivorans]
MNITHTIPAYGIPAPEGTAGDQATTAIRSQGVLELQDIDVLVKNYRARILRFVTFSTGDPDLAETLTQDCLLKAWNARASFRAECSLNTWLTSIALNLVRDHQRTQKFKFWKQAKATAVDVSDVASFVATDETSADKRLIAREQVGRLSGILETLSMNQRTAFLMKFSDDMNLEEISKAMNMPVNTVKTHLHRALKAVRTQLGAKP